MIPTFDSNLVIPPHLGNPIDRTQLSPYQCTTVELCKKFATSPERIKILQGLLQFRDIIAKANITSGFQWLGGSFIEDKESRLNLPPRDLDIATMFCASNEVLVAAAKNYPILVDQPQTKLKYHLDHYLVDIAYNPILTVDQTRYWLSIFSHTRDQIWKGMLRIELNTPEIDLEAKNILDAS